MMRITDLLNENKEIQSWEASFLRQDRNLLTGLDGSAKALVMAHAFESSPGKFLILVDSQFRANEIYDDLSSFLDSENLYQYFSDDNVYAEFAISSKDRMAYRIEALEFLVNPKSEGILIAPLQTLRNFLPNPKQFFENIVDFQKDSEYIFQVLLSSLSKRGFERVQRVSSPGEFAQRGDILDIYPLNVKHPRRLEFFGDTLESIRIFDANTQKSLQAIDSFRLLPADDLQLSAAEFDRAVNLLSKVIETASIDGSKSYFEELLAAAKKSEIHQDFRKYAGQILENPSTLLDYFSPGDQLFVDDFPRINEMDKKINLELTDFLMVETELGRVMDSSYSYLKDILPVIRKRKSSSFFVNFQKGLGNIKFDRLYTFQQHSMQEFFGQLDLLYVEVDRFVRQGYTVVLSVASDKLKRQLEETEILQIKGPDNMGVSGAVKLSNLTASRGFVFLDEKVVLITQEEIFGKTRKKRMRRLNMTNADRLKDYNELEIGDFVVHRTHGIGRYLGIQTLKIGGLHRDYLTLEYQKGDTLSVPVDQLASLSKYNSSEGKRPAINRLNDGRWKRTLSNATKEVEDISEDLINLYAERLSQEGFSFSADDENQSAFDAGFPYVETEDQLRSIDEVKTDMQKSRPMDRLLVGDVGFGKTEVAMRAAFKAINDGKQVAILVPTTVLAEQHFQTMQSRFYDFAINVAVLSRFQTKAQQNLLLENLKKGQIDLVIGTHRLLSQDVIFSDLGLIVVDEEQRFGVKHKERLKSLRSQVDVLTLTATPIPRTLHMSMLGIRDLSIIETAPTNRYPIQTYVMETNFAVVRDALLREMSRGGQAFYVLNRVDQMSSRVSQLEALIPEARIGFIHGRMPEALLEETLLSFVSGEFDLLVTTTIVETGVDIPNANTLFIEDADKFGLSQLYQLRGRVGRTNRVAYAYFLYRPEKVLSEIAEKRLGAIKGFTELGAGFKIAMRDLSIRGAGNLLGAEQSGFIDSIGYDLYSELLDEAVKRKMGKAASLRKTNAEINLGLDAYIPNAYMGDERQKIEVYKRIRILSSREEKEQLEEELVDRFGAPPEQVSDLLQIGLLKNLSDQALVKTISKKQQQIVVQLDQTSKSLYEGQDYFEALQNVALKAEVTENQKFITIALSIQTDKSSNLTALISLVSSLSEISKKRQASQKSSETSAPAVL